MSQVQFSFRAPAFAEFRDATHAALFVFVGYLFAAELAFLIGTLSDRIFAPFWPPNIVLLAALLLQPRQRVWLCVAAAFPAHAIAEMRIGMPVPQMVVAFATNVAVAVASAALIRKLLGQPPWFATLRKTAIYITVVGIACPAVVALGGAFVPLLGGSSQPFSVMWLQWLAANTLGNLTLGPIAVILAGEGLKAFWPSRRTKQIEALCLILALLVATNLAFGGSAGRTTEAFMPSLLYAPLPLILWCAVRFGAVGASAGILTMTIALVGRALNGPSLFLGGTPEANVLALQIFLVCLAVPVLLLGASIDQIRKGERKSREDEDRIALAVAAANLGFWHYDSTSKLLTLSPDCRRLLGFAKEDHFTPADIASVVHPADVAVATEALFPTEACLEKRGGVEFRVVLPDGQKKHLLIWSRSKPQEEGDSLETSGILIDVSAQRAADAEADQQRRELAHLMRVSQVGELSSGLAHELTQPLTAILANAQAARLMLENSPADLSVIAEVLEDIIREDQRAGEVIRRLRSLLKDSENRSEDIDLNGLLEATLQLLKNEFISKRVNVICDFDPGAPLVFGDQIQLQQVFLNLITNAIEAVHQMAIIRRSILIKTRRSTDDIVELNVIDHGVGIKPADQMRLFEPFFTTKERGLGLGLSICTTIVARHRGTLTLENNPEGGATASLRMPLEPESGARS